MIKITIEVKRRRIETFGACVGYEYEWAGFDGDLQGMRTKFPSYDPPLPEQEKNIKHLDSQRIKESVLTAMHFHKLRKANYEELRSANPGDDRLLIYIGSKIDRMNTMKNDVRIVFIDLPAIREDF